METAIPFILLALKGRSEFINRTSPYGGTSPDKGDKEDPSPELRNQRIRDAMASFRKRH